MAKKYDVTRRHTHLRVTIEVLGAETGRPVQGQGLVLELAPRQFSSGKLGWYGQSGDESIGRLAGCRASAQIVVPESEGFGLGDLDAWVAGFRLGMTEMAQAAAIEGVQAARQSAAVRSGWVKGGDPTQVGPALLI